VRAEDYGVIVSQIGDRKLPHPQWQYRPESEGTG
jgi:hypothetical protein